MLETSQDILFITIAFCVLLLSVMLALALYYMVVILKRAKEVANVAKEKIEKMLNVLDIFRNKIEPVAQLAAGVVVGIKQLLNYAKKQSKKRPARQKEAKKESGEE